MIHISIFYNNFRDKNKEYLRFKKEGKFQENEYEA